MGGGAIIKQSMKTNSTILAMVTRNNVQLYVHMIFQTMYLHVSSALSTHLWSRTQQPSLYRLQVHMLQVP